MVPGRVCLRRILEGDGAMGARSVFIKELNTGWKIFEFELGNTQMFRPIQYLFSNEPVLCEVIKQEKYLNAYKIADTEFRNLTNGIKFRDVKYGDGHIVEAGDIVNVQFTGRLVGGREIETTLHQPGGYVTIKAGGSDVVRVVSDGIIGMGEYGSRELLAPPMMHYPDRFPNQVMIYDVMVRTVARKQNAPPSVAPPKNTSLFSFFSR